MQFILHQSKAKKKITKTRNYAFKQNELCNLNKYTVKKIYCVISVQLDVKWNKKLNIFVLRVCLFVYSTKKKKKQKNNLFLNQIEYKRRGFFFLK